MLGEAGSVASLLGVVVSLGGMGFAIWQLSRLRGETRAAREASEATRRAIGRELASTELTRLSERIQGLKEIHRIGDRLRALDLYSDIVGMLLEIRRRHPGLSSDQRIKIVQATTQIIEMERSVESLDAGIPQDTASQLNNILTGIQSTLLSELEDQLQETAQRGT